MQYPLTCNFTSVLRVNNATYSDSMGEGSKEREREGETKDADFYGELAML